MEPTDRNLVTAKMLRDLVSDVATDTDIPNQERNAHPVGEADSHGDR